jgi:hypothetical protein
MTEDSRKPEPVRSGGGTPFKQMTQKQKVAFVFKVIVCVITFGIVFPNVMSD